MNTEQLEQFEELARRAVACKHWRWMPGMLSNKGLRVTRCDDDGYVVGYYEHLSYIAECVKGSTPDFSDSPTVGALFYLVRNAWGPTVYLIAQGGWLVQGARLPDGSTINLGICRPTEVEALVAALEAAP